MSDVLSQSEIDSLLQQLSSGEVTADDLIEPKERQVKEYDFARPSKFSKEHLRTLEIIFEHYARLLSTNLPVYLRKNIQIEVMNSEAITYFEFTNSLANPVLLGIIDFYPIPGSVLMELSTSIGYAFVDRMLGGAGAPLEKTREFSEIELIILERILNICVNLMPEPWENVAELSPRLERIETNPQFAQIISPGEMIAIVTLNIKFGESEGLMNICLPFMTLESVIDRLNTRFWFASIKEKDSETYNDIIETVIRKAPMPVKVVLGKTLISVSDFVGLAPGDIIRLDKSVDEELDIYVSNIRKFTALPGSVGDDYAVRITSIIREED